MQKQVGFIGLGDIGQPMALCIARAGLPLLVYDIRSERMAPLIAAGARAATSAREVAAASAVLVTMVLNHIQLEQVLTGEDGALKGLGPSKTLVAMSSIPPSQAVRLSELVKTTGASYLDSPVSGGSIRAAQGDLSIMVGGPADVLEECRPVLEAMGSKIYHVGPNVGNGQSLKMVNQLLMGVHLATAAEAMVLGIKAGLDPEMIYDMVCHSTGQSWAFVNRIDRVMARDFQSKGALRTLHKDMGIVVTMASELQVPLLLAPVAYQVFQMGMLSGLGGEDDSALCKVMENLAGVEIRRAEKAVGGGER